MTRVVLVTGVSRYLGGRFARALSNEPDAPRVIGVDVIPPPHDIGGAQFVRADIRNPVIARVIADTGVDTVVHMNVIATPVSAGGRVSQKEINVIGTMQLLAACQKAPSLQRLVVKSSSAVYGTSPRDPAMFTEDTGPESHAAQRFRQGLGRGRGLRPRASPVAGPTSRSRRCGSPTSSARASGPRSPTTSPSRSSPSCSGTTRGCSSSTRTTRSRRCGSRRSGRPSGVVNVAGDGVITTKQAARLIGRPTIPVPLNSSGWIGQLVRRSGLADFSPDQMMFLAYGRGLDTTRMRRSSGSTRRTRPGRRSRTSPGCTAGRAARASAPWWGRTDGRPGDPDRRGRRRGCAVEPAPEPAVERSRSSRPKPAEAEELGRGRGEPATRAGPGAPGGRG